jgi:hypothetical protein
VTDILLSAAQWGAEFSGGLDAVAAAAKVRDQADYEQHQKNKEEQLCDAGGCDRNTCEAENCREDRDQ